MNVPSDEWVRTRTEHGHLREEHGDHPNHSEHWAGYFVCDELSWFFRTYGKQIWHLCFVHQGINEETVSSTTVEVWIYDVHPNWEQIAADPNCLCACYFHEVQSRDSNMVHTEAQVILEAVCLDEECIWRLNNCFCDSSCILLKCRNCFENAVS